VEKTKKKGKKEEEEKVEQDDRTEDKANLLAGEPAEE